MITVTRRDLTHGYQTAQTTHAMSEFAKKHPVLHKKWAEISGYLICLSVKDAKELKSLMNTLREKGVKYTSFFEPDVNQITAITIHPSPEADKLTKKLQLANKSSGTLDKNKVGT